MSEMSPRELDKLFQQGSEQYDFEYNAQAWVQMEALLDKKKRRRFIWWWFGAGLALLIIIGLGFIKKDTISTATMSDISNPKVEFVDSLSAKEKIKDRERKETVKGKSKLKEDSTTRSSVRSLEDSVQSNIDGQRTFLKSVFSKERAVMQNKKFKNRKEAPPIAAMHSQKMRQKDEYHAEVILEQIPLIQYNKPERNVEILDTSISYIDAIVSKIPTLKLLPSAYSRKQLSIVNDQIADDERIGKEKKPSTKKSANVLILGLIGGGELASAGADNFSKINWKIGGQVEYRYAHKYSFGVGANYMRKTYEAGEGEYTPPKGFWVNSIAPESSEGKCNILEIPVLLGYFPKGYLNRGFYSNIGFSSYLILTERYNYFYESSDPSLIRAWGTENENRHWFGIGHIAIGYNYVTKRKYSFQIEPYLQLPLTGVGHGQVKLWSAGVSFKANWQMN